MKELKCSQDFSHYKSKGIFPDAQGQLSPQSDLAEFRIRPRCYGCSRYRPFSVYKKRVLLIFSFITGDKTEFLSPMMFSNEYITGI